MKNYKLIDPFSTPLFIADVNKNDYNITLINNEINKCLVKLKNKISFERFDGEYYTKDISNFKASCEPGNEKCNIIEEYNLINLKIKIMECLNEYFYSIHEKTIEDSMIDVNIISSWATSSYMNNYISVHHHHNLDVSGVYYHKVLKDSGNINFRSTNKCAEISAFYKRNPDYTIEPKNGMLILFPSWMDHFVTSNQTEDERISISFIADCSYR